MGTTIAASNVREAKKEVFLTKIMYKKLKHLHFLGHAWRKLYSLFFCFFSFIMEDTLFHLPSVSYALEIF